VRKNAKGFTMIEVLVVMVVIMVLAGLTAAAIGGIRKQVFAKATRSIFDQLDTALADYKMVYGEYPPDKATVPQELNDATPVLCISGECLWYFLSLSFSPDNEDDAADPLDQYNERFSQVTGGPFIKSWKRDENVFDFAGKAGLDGAANEHYSVCDGWGVPLVYDRNPVIDRSDTTGVPDDPDGEVDEGDDIYESTHNPFQAHNANNIVGCYNLFGVDIYSAGMDGIYEDGEGDDLNNWDDAR